MTGAAVAGPAAQGLARVLTLAAAPTFAALALVAAMQPEGPAAMLCSPGHGSPLTGMATMYAVMSAFHLAPWLRLLARVQRRGAV